MSSSHTPRLPLQAPEGIKSPVATSTNQSIELSGLQIINGYQLNVNDRVLVKDQTNGAENGIYSAQEGQWVRTQDWKVSRQVANGVLILDNNTGLIWRGQFAGVLDVGSTLVTFSLVKTSTDLNNVTLTSLISSNATSQPGDLVRTIGYQNVFDGGQALWQATDSTGLTPSQSPTQRGGAEFTDGSGRLWKYAEHELRIESLGAVGDDVQDNALHIAAAQSWSNETKSKVILGRGTFLYSGSITADGTYLHVEGVSRTESILKQDDFTSGDAIGVLSDGYLTIKNLTINHNSTGNGKTAGHGIRSGGHMLLEVDHVDILDSLGYGFAIQQGTARSTYLTNFKIDGAGNDAIDIKDRAFNSECVFINNGYITNFSRADNDDCAIDIRGEALVNNIKITATSSCIGVRFRLGTPSAGRSGFGSFNNILFDGQNVQGTIAIGHESDSKSAVYNNIIVKDAIYPWISYLGSVGGQINNITCTGVVVANFGGTGLLVDNLTMENIEASSRMFDYASTAKDNRTTNVNLQNNASTGELARHAAGADNNKIIGGISNTIAVNQLGTNWTLSLDNVEPKDATALLTNVERTPTRKDWFSDNDSRVWQFKKKLWSGSRISKGSRATWTRVFDSVDSFFDSASGCVGAYYTFKVNPAYSGPCIRIENEDTTVQTDIGFNGDGNLDFAALNKALAGATARVVTWYDQSGQNRHVTTSAANAPVVGKIPDENGIVSIVFEKPITSGFVETPEQFMTIPTSLTVASTALSIAVYGKLSHSTRTAPFVQISSGATATSVGVNSQSGINSVALYQRGDLKISSDYIGQINDNFIMATYATNETKLYFNDEESEGVSGAGDTNATLQGGRIGGNFDNFLDGNSNPLYGGAMMKGFSIYNRVVTSVEHRDVYRALCKQLDLKPQVRGRVIYDGDSITEGDGALDYQSWPRACAELTQHKHRPYLVAKSGGDITTQSAGFSEWGTELFKTYEPYNVIVLMIGSNDLAAGTSVASLKSQVESYIATATAEGYDVVLTTILPRNSFTGTSTENDRLTYNSDLRTSYKSMGAVGLIDWDFEGTMGTVANTTNTAYYQDGTHPTTYGYSLLAMYAAQELDTIIETLY